MQCGGKGSGDYWRIWARGGLQCLFESLQKWWSLRLVHIFRRSNKLCLIQVGLQITLSYIFKKALFREFNGIDASCTTCRSGEKGCTEIDDLICDRSGICDGNFVGITKTNSAQGCLSACKNTAGCGWFSFDGSVNDCLMTENCLDLVETCAECVNGQVNCTLDGGKFSNYLITVLK